MTTSTQSALHTTSSSRRGDPIAMCAADDAYAIPLAVTLTTAAQRLSPGRRLTVYVIDTGIREANWIGLKESIADLPLDIVHIPADLSRLSHLKTSHHISHTAFVRLLADYWLPPELDRVIYLDSDLLFRDDLCKLWHVDLERAIVAAVPDIACPFIDARHAPSNFRRASPYLATIAPVRNWRELGLDPAQPYFNSGLMLMNLKAWRRQRLSDQFLKCMAENERHVWCWDQYALNVVLAKRWKALPLRWNQGTHAFEYPGAEYSPVGTEEFRELIEDPAVIHFTSEFKPWRYGSRHPQCQAYFHALQDTAWRDWRPTKPAWSPREACDRFGAALHKRAMIAARKFNALVRRVPQTTIPARVFPSVDLTPDANSVHAPSK